MLFLCSRLDSRINRTKSFNATFKILAFPSNDFGSQEPDDIDTICRNMKEKYNVNFEIFDKVAKKK